MEQIYSVKMRAANGTRHISGAERILPAAELHACVSALTERALHHSKGTPDLINIKIEAIPPSELLELPALKTTTISVASKEEGHRYLKNFLMERGIPNAAKILALLLKTRDMRGAILLDPRTMKRLEEDPQRGVRATYMDYKMHNALCAQKNHYSEALALATKVLSAPGIIAELCISDDPDYVTGYVATQADGYVRITKLKEKGSRAGARIFLYTGTPKELPTCLSYLTKQKVWIV